MEIYQALILGIVQGITELLPISSSAHGKKVKRDNSKFIRNHFVINETA